MRVFGVRQRRQRSSSVTSVTLLRPSGDWVACRYFSREVSGLCLITPIITSITTTTPITHIPTFTPINYILNIVLFSPRLNRSLALIPYSVEPNFRITLFAQWSFAKETPLLLEQGMIVKLLVHASLLSLPTVRKRPLKYRYLSRIYREI